MRSQSKRFPIRLTAAITLPAAALLWLGGCGKDGVSPDVEGEIQALGEMSQGCYYDEADASPAAVFFAFKKGSDGNRYDLVFDSCNSDTELSSLSNWTRSSLDASTYVMSYGNLDGTYAFRSGGISFTCTQRPSGQDLYQKRLRLHDWAGCSAYLKQIEAHTSNPETLRRFRTLESVILEDPLKAKMDLGVPGGPTSGEPIPNHAEAWRFEPNFGNPRGETSTSGEMAMSVPEVSPQVDYLAARASFVSALKPHCPMGKTSEMQKIFDARFSSRLDGLAKGAVVQGLGNLRAEAGSVDSIQDAKYDQVRKYYREKRHIELPSTLKIVHVPAEALARIIRTEAAGVFVPRIEEEYQLRSYLSPKGLIFCGGSSEHGLMLLSKISIKNGSEIYDQLLKHWYGSKDIIYIAKEAIGQGAVEEALVVHEAKHLLDYRRGRFTMTAGEAKTLKIAAKAKVAAIVNPDEALRSEKQKPQYKEFLALAKVYCDDRFMQAEGREQCYHIEERNYLTFFNRALESLEYLENAMERSAFIDFVQYLKWAYGYSVQDVLDLYKNKVDTLISPEDESAFVLRSGKKLVVDMSWPGFIQDYFARLHKIVLD